jgi:hypothetical protein
MACIFQPDRRPIHAIATMKIAWLRIAKAFTPPPRCEFILRNGIR